MATIFEKLMKVQAETKCRKSQYNTFGKYNYRNVEDIWEAVKPVAENYGAVLTCTDRIVQIGDRYYVEATATIYDIETGENINATANAREDESKKGMDGSQITGTSTSYARKYAMGGLLGLDDTADADTNAYKRELDAKAGEPTEPDNQDAEHEREIKIKQCVALAEKQGRAAQINADGYKGKPWNTVTDENLTKLKLWLVSSGKEK